MSTRFASRATRRPRWGALLLVLLLHVLIITGLIRAFTPDFAAAVAERASSLVSVPVESSPPAPEPKAGQAAEKGRKAEPKAVTAPEVPRPVTTSAPRAPATGSAASSGSAEQGVGAGAGGAGVGTGSGAAGGGSGGGAVARPVKIAGDIDDARDYPTPPGGRQIRIGHSVTIALTVGTDGRAHDCRVLAPSPDPEADRITCQLALQRFRFRPALDADGNPVPATYGWRQSWFTR